MFLNDTGINLLSVSGILDCDHLARVDPHPEGQGLHGRGILFISNLCQCLVKGLIPSGFLK